MTAVLLALLTAVVYGLANYLGPLLSRAHPLGAVLVVGQTVGAVGALLLLAVEGGGPPDARHLLLGVLAGCCNGVALAALYAAAAAGPISIVAPIGSTGAIVPVVVAIAGGERPALLQLVGIPLAMGGVVLAAARDGGGGQQAGRRTVALAVLSAAAFGGFLALFGRASGAGVAWAVVSSRFALVACTATVLLVLRASASVSVSVRVPVRALPALAVPGALLLVGTVSYATATTKGLLSVVSVIATLSPVVTVGLAVLVLGERLATRQRLGVVTALVGVVLLAAG